MNNIGTQIKYLRKSENLTQIDFSKRLLISQSYLSGLENGNETPNNKLVKLICLEFGINESWLIEGTGEMYSTVFENDKSSLVDISNSALLSIMSLLATKSNVEYGLYAYTLRFLALIMDRGSTFKEENKLIYLELIQNLNMNLERMIQVSVNNCEISVLENHKSGLYQDINELVSFLGMKEK